MFHRCQQWKMQIWSVLVQISKWCTGAHVVRRNNRLHPLQFSKIVHYQCVHCVQQWVPLNGVNCTVQEIVKGFLQHAYGLWDGK